MEEEKNANVVDTEFQIGIQADDALYTALENIPVRIKDFDDEFITLRGFFEGEDALWQGKDAEALREQVTKDGGVLQKLERYHDQMDNLKVLAQSLSDAIVSAEDTIKNNINKLGEEK